MKALRYISAFCLLFLVCVPVSGQGVRRTAVGVHPGQSVALDGPALTASEDSLSLDVRRDILPAPLFSAPMTFEMFSKMPVPAFETKQQRAARLNLNTAMSVMNSLRGNLAPDIPHIPYYLYPALFVAGFFLTPQFSVPYGYYPMMHPANYFAVAKIPGNGPEAVGMYSPEVIPQCIELEYDFATGTYKQKMVDWNTFEKRMSTINPANFNIAPVPRIPINDVERRVWSGNMY